MEPRPRREAQLVRACALALFIALVGCAEAAPRTMTDASDGEHCAARYALARRRPELAIVLDRSCAMRARFDGSMATGPDDPAGRWGATRAALDEVLRSGAISGAGLVLTPDEPGSCEVGSMRVEPGPGSIDATRSTLAMDRVVDPFALCESGPAALSLQAALGALAASESLGATGEPLVLVITADAPACGESASSLADAVSAIGVDVAVLGLSADASALLDGLDADVRMASHASEVGAALGAIADEHASCVLDLVGPPLAHPEALRVWVDGHQVAADADEGWAPVLGEDAIVLNGSLCERLVAGALGRIDAAVGCEEPRCVPREEACDGLDDDCDTRVDEGCS